MFDLITKSKIRKNILLLFVYNPEKEYYVNEVARLVKTSSGTAARELEKLVRGGFLRKEKKANRTYFMIDNGSNVAHDIRNIIDKTIGLEYILKRELQGLKGILFSFIFGSYAMGGMKADSDIDLYIIGSVDEDELHARAMNAEKYIHREINYHVARLDEFAEKLKTSFFHKKVVENHILLFGDEPEFRKIIERTA